MTEAKFENKLRDLSNVLRDNLELEALRLFNSGGVDTESFEDNYALPKICLSVALEKETAFQYKPLTQRHKRIVNNLKKF